MSEIRNKPEKKEPDRKAMQAEARNQQYQDLVKEMTPSHSLPVNMLKAFLVGGVICTIGQGLMNYCQSLGLDKEMSSSWTSLALILLSVILTMLHLYGPLAKFGGAGALVPITGFANSVAAPAAEYKAEGWVFGVGCQIFTIAGPVILYGLLSSWGLGIIYGLLKLWGVM